MILPVTPQLLQGLRWTAYFSLYDVALASGWSAGDLVAAMDRDLDRLIVDDKLYCRPGPLLALGQSGP
ncbi:MAG: hypothetical protein R3F60_26630 [bacterium]